MSRFKSLALCRACLTILIFTTFFTHAYPQVRTDNQSLARVSPEHFLNGDFRERLRPRAKELLDYVERAYGKEVRVKVMKGWDRHIIGESWLGEDGVPEIRLNASTGCTEVCFVHELFHLKLKAGGYPAILLRSELTGSERAYYENAARLVREALQHRAFYPEMRSMGLAPEAMERDALKQIVRDDRDEGVKVAPDEISMALYYFRACLEVEDRELISELEELYEKRQLVWALETGKRLVRLAGESGPQTPEEEIALLIRCLNILFFDKVGFEVRDRVKRFDIENVTVIHIIPR